MAKLVNDRNQIRMILYMPNQLLSMDLTGLDRFQIESLEVMFYNTQHELKFGESVELNNFNKRIYKIQAEELFGSITDVSSRISIKILAKKLEKLTSISANTFDKHSIGSFSLFPSVVYLLEENVLVYTLADELETSFNNGNTVICAKNDKDSKKKYFTPMDLIKIKNMDLSDYARNFFRSAMSSFTMMDKKEFAELDYGITEFRAVMSLGNKYKRYSDLKEYVLDKISDELKTHDILVEFSNRTFRKQTTHITAKFTITKEFEEMCEYMRSLANSKDSEKKPTIPKEENHKKKTPEVKQLKETKQLPASCFEVEGNPFVAPKKLGYDLIKREEAFEYFHTLLENSHISSDINKVQTYTQYCDKVCDYFKEEYYRYKVNMEEFEKGYTFRYFND